jgi:predicted nucleic acid-binding protein
MHDSLVIADSSCLIILSKIDQLDLLRNNYSRIIITEEIAKEFDSELPAWIEIKGIKDKKLQLLFEEVLDLGEATALTLAFETEDCTVILDDLKARKIAAKLNLKVTATIGVIVKAKQQGTIYSVKPLFEKILATDFRISDKVIKEAILEAGE